jgi:elongation factor Ts
MTITAADVNKLRQQTGAGMMECKKALEQSNGNFEAAIDFLRKKGLKVSEQRAGRVAKEGRVVAKVSADGTTGVVVALNCETDFVAKNQDFIAHAEKFADIALAQRIHSLEQLLSAPTDGITVADKVTDLVAKINEKIEISKVAMLEAPTVVAYNHSNGKIGVLLGLNQAPNNEIIQIGRDLAMQVAALSPVAVDANQVPKEVIDREMDIAREQTIAEGKPAEMIEKIAHGRVQKVLKEITLINQPFVKDNTKLVSEVLKSVNKDLQVTGFVRVAIS